MDTSSLNENAPGSAPEVGPESGATYQYNPTALRALQDQGAQTVQAAAPQPAVDGAPVSQPAPQPAVGGAPAPSSQPAPAPATQPAPSQVPPSPYPAQGTAPAAQASPVPPKKEKGKGWIVALVAILVFGGVCVFGIQSCSSSLGALSLLDSTYSEPSMAASESVGLIVLDGTIAYDGSACSPEGFKRMLDRAADDPNVKAVVIRVNSGGGTATAGEEMTTYLNEFKEETGKPVVVSSASVNASAAYEITSQADYIYAAKSSAVGAIGTIMQSISYAELLEKLGIKIDNIASAESKDSSYGTRELTKEERAQYQHQVDQITDNFVEVVAKGRNMSEKAVRKLATGMTYTGTDCVENGLVDAIGTQQDAVDKAAELAGISNPDTISLEETTEDWSSLMGLLGSSNMSVSDLVAALEEMSNGKAVQ